MVNSSDKVPSSAVAEQVLLIHKSRLSIDKENLNRRILKYKWYRLQEIPLDDLEREHGSFEHNSTDTRVADYFVQDQSAIPPIVLGCKYSSGLYEVVDGIHRAAAKRKRGEPIIQAYVPLSD
ncbi:hypothetical protein O9H85_36150 [Paenibacillus filicis]|uniref:ParB/Sulfiredoxin domain-containing protein n=1 Tax=Paenibacillus gyeongsangnamensis TaxID=3388067 RepID=A0ABT4QLB9_9BACL|nr:hypothetical protein [Paenibacillus filicis]MCZ8517662.1 hypothetical protein [Paenibacillus filicis]